MTKKSTIISSQEITVEQSPEPLAVFDRAQKPCDSNLSSIPLYRLITELSQQTCMYVKQKIKFEGPRKKSDMVEQEFVVSKTRFRQLFLCTKRLNLHKNSDLT